MIVFEVALMPQHLGVQEIMIQANFFRQMKEYEMSAITSSGIRDHPAERFLTVNEIATRWGLSAVSVRRLFLHEPGVLVFGTREAQAQVRKRVYRTLRIPESVVGRVQRRLAN